MKNFSVSAIQCFCAVAEHRSFSFAALSLGVAQSTVSKAVSKIENQLGVVLFERDSVSGLSLSKAGVDLFQASRHYLSRLEGMANGFDVTERLRVGASTLLAREVVPQLMLWYMETLENSTCDLEVASSAQILESLKAGELDVGLTGLRSSDKGIVQRKILRDEFVLISSVNNQTVPRRIRQLSDLAHLRFVSEQPSSGVQIELRRAIERAGLSYRSINHCFYSGLFDSLIFVVQHSDMVAFASKLAVRKLVNNRCIRVVDIEGLNLDRYLYLAYRLSHQAHPGIKQFVDLATKGLASYR